MAENIVGLLKYLDPGDEAIQALVDAFWDCQTAAQADQLIKKIKCREDEYKPDFRAADKKPFCSILYAAAYSIREKPAKSMEHLEDAERGFNCSGQEKHLAVARWMHGLLHMQDGHPELAKLDLEAAAAGLERLAVRHRRVGRYEKAEECLGLAEQIKEITPETSQLEALKINVKPGRGKTKAHRPSPAPKSAPRFGALVFPVYSPVSAGKGGDFVFDSLPQGQASISELTIDEVPYRVFSLKADEPVTMHARIHRWMYVQGDSMNQAAPHPLLEGDCILVVETGSSGLGPKANDIVVAALLDPASNADRAGVVKRYTSKGLCSESSQAYPPIPLKKARVKGIVLAVAKPIDPEN